MPRQSPGLSFAQRTAPIEALIFDLDDTLIDTQRAYSQALAAIDIDADSAAFRAARHTVKARLGPGHVCAHNRLLYFKVLFEGYGMGPRRILARMHAYEECLGACLQAQWQRLERGRLISVLRGGTSRKKKPRPCIILTNENTRTQLLKWQAIDPEGTLFSALLTSEELGYEKPNASVFAAALHRVNVAPERCLMVGDNLDADILPAVAHGMAAVWTHEFHRGVGPAAPAGVAEVDCLDHLAELYPW